MFSSSLFIANLFGLLLIAADALSAWPKSRKNMLLVNVAANFIHILALFFADARAGYFAVIITFIRSVVYYFFVAKGKSAPKWVMLLFCGLQIIATFLGWKNRWSLLTLSLIFNTWGQWQKDDRIFRICLLLNGLSLGIYAALFSVWTVALNKVIQVVSTALKLWSIRTFPSTSQLSSKNLFGSTDVSELD